MPWMAGLSLPRLCSQRVLDPCGSKSMSAGLCPAAAKQAARFVATVVFPDPPFGLRTVILCIALSADRGREDRVLVELTISKTFCRDVLGSSENSLTALADDCDYSAANLRLRS